MKTTDRHEPMRRLERLLSASALPARMADWYEALISLSRFGGEEVWWCVDASEVIEHLVPSSLRRVGMQYPTVHDLALFHLFQPSPQTRLLVLPFHAREINTALHSWLRHLRSLSYLTHELVEHSERWLRQLLSTMPHGEPGEDAEAWCRLVEQQFFQVYGVLQRAEAGVFDQYYAMLEGGQLSLPSGARLGIGDWHYEPNDARIHDWFQWLQHESNVRRLPKKRRSNWVDAHAIDFIIAINEVLEDGAQILPWLTHSPRIWSLLDKKPELLPRREGIPLIQDPCGLLLRVLDLGSVNQIRCEDDKTMAKWAEQWEHAEALKALRVRLAACIDFLRREGSANESVESVAATVEEHLSVLRSRQEEWQNVALAIGTPAPANPTGLLAEWHRAVSERGGSARSFMAGRLDSIEHSIRATQRRISLCFTPEPRDEIEIRDVDETCVQLVPGAETVGHAYSFRFVSAPVKRSLRALEGLIARVHAAGDETSAHDALQAELYRIEAALSRAEPEYYLLLSYAFGTQARWLEACDAAQQGIRQIWPDTPRLEDIEVAPSKPTASLTCELLVAFASTLRRQAMMRVSVVGLLHSRFNRAMADLQTCLRLRSRWDVGPEDGRCHRELSAIFAVAGELNLKLPLVEARAYSRCEMFRLSLEHGRRGLTVSQDDRLLRLLCLNNILFAVARLASLRASDVDIVGYQDDAKQLENSVLGNSVHVLDTLSIFYLELAKQAGGADRQARFTKTAAELNAAARDRLTDQMRSDPYTRLIIDRHQREIEGEVFFDRMTKPSDER